MWVFTPIDLPIEEIQTILYKWYILFSHCPVKFKLSNCIQSSVRSWELSLVSILLNIINKTSGVRKVTFDTLAGRQKAEAKVKIVDKMWTRWEVKEFGRLLYCSKLHKLRWNKIKYRIDVPNHAIAPEFKLYWIFSSFQNKLGGNQCCIRYRYK